MTSSSDNTNSTSPMVLPVRPLVRKPPSAALLQLLSPDGYYTYLNIAKMTDGGDIDEEQIKKNYRKLSLKHHPDRPTGDDESFRLLNRAQKVLLHPKLRQQYDWLGIDLEEDGEEKHDNGEEGDSSSEPLTPETIMSQMATATLGTLLQIIIRTATMGLVAVLLVRYRLTLFPAVAFLVFVSYRVHSVTATTPSNSMDMLSPLIISVGLVLMYRGRSDDMEWSSSFWIGEALVLTMFSFNSMPGNRTPAIGFLLAILSILVTFWLAGKMWRYTTVIGLEVLAAIVCALAFPVMELIVEQIITEKLKKVGEKVRQQHERMQAYYTATAAASVVESS